MIKHQIEMISPSRAKEFLSKNFNNRPLNQRRVNALSSAIKRGEWALNGASIRFSEDGVLLDGQHRLAAIEKSECSVLSLVVYGLPSSTFDTIDVGMAARTAADVLALRGELNYNTLAAVARRAMLWRKTGNPFHSSVDLNPTVKQIEGYIDENKSIREHVNFTTSNVWSKRYLTGSVSGFCCHAFSISNISDRVHEFFDLLQSGERSQKNCPVFLLRDVLMEDKNARDKMTAKYRCALVFKAYKKFVAMEPTKNLRIRLSGNVEKDLFVLPGVEANDT